MGRLLDTAHHGQVLTSPANLGSISTGDMFVMAGQLFVVLFNDQIRDGALVVGQRGSAARFETNNRQGNRINWWSMSPNMPMARVVGARAGGHR